MTDKVLDIVAEELMNVEGGLSLDPRDRGNWTGGQINVGKLRGTKHGISAAAFPNEDIASMTEEKAKILFKNKYWNPCKCDKLSDPISIMVSDTAYNSGPKWAAVILQRCVGTKQDGIIGNITLSAANSMDQLVLLNSYKSKRLQFLRSLSTWSIYGSGWTDRVNKMYNLAKGYL